VRPDSAVAYGDVTLAEMGLYMRNRIAHNYWTIDDDVV
jgi:uncharacterized protein YutE (UPF0331/DUF86 family)